MAHRYTNTNKWNDEWFLELSAGGKCLFEYVRDNCDNAGFIEIGIRKICMMTNLTAEQATSAVEEIKKCYIKSKDGKYIWIKNFIREQKNLPLNPKNPAHRQIIRLIESHLYSFDFNQEIAILLPEQTRKEVIGALMGHHRSIEGARKELQTLIQTDKTEKTQGASKEHGRGQGIGMGIGNSNVSSKQDTSVTNADSDFEIKSESVLNEKLELDFEKENAETAAEKSETISEEKEPELVEAEEVKEPDHKSNGHDKSQKKTKKQKSDQSINTKFRNIFEEWYLDIKKMPYYWSAKCAGNMTGIISKTKFYLKETNGSDEEIPDLTLESVFKAILLAIKHKKPKYLMENLTVATLNSKYQESIAEAKIAIETGKSEYDSW